MRYLVLILVVLVFSSCEKTEKIEEKPKQSELLDFIQNRAKTVEALLDVRDQVSSDEEKEAFNKKMEELSDKIEKEQVTVDVETVNQNII